MGFTETTYDILTIPFPTGGVNTTVTPQGLPISFAQHLENIIPSKEGTGSVRNGTTLLHDEQDLGKDSTILEVMPYAKQDGTLQLLAYVLNYKDDLASNFAYKGKNSISFNTTQQARYIEDLPLRLTYKQGLTLRTIFVYATRLQGNNPSTLTFYGDELPGVPVTIVAIGYAVGAIYSFDETTGHYTNLKDNLAGLCIPRFTEHAGELFICNGVDDNYRWDGTTLHPVVDILKDVSASLTWISQNSFEFDINQTTNIDHYQPGTKVSINASIVNQPITSITRVGNSATLTCLQNHNLPNGTLVTISGATQTAYNQLINVSGVSANTFKYNVVGNPQSPATGAIRIDVGEYIITGVIQTAVVVGNKLKITLTNNLLPGFNTVLNSLSYEVKVPPFSYVYAAHDRIWALGAGVPHPQRFRANGDALRVYFTQFENSTTQWFSQTTQSVPSIEMAGKHLIADNFEGMAKINGGMAFFGRNATQIWLGIDPTLDEDKNFSFAWSRTIPVGCVHGNLIQNLPNDAAFISPYGERTLGSINISQQFATGAEMGGAVDKTVLDYVNALLSDPVAYRAARSWKYSTTLGFRFGRMALVYNLTNIAQGWVFFSGDFERATTYVKDHLNRLLLAIGNNLYRYADGNISDGTLNWADNGGNGAISWAWIIPWLKPGRGQWGNKRFELIMSPGQSVPISIFYALNNNLGISYIQDLKTKQEGGFWGKGLWDSAKWGSNYANPQGRLKFMGSTFLLGMQGTTNTGPVDIFKLRLYGEAER